MSAPEWASPYYSAWIAKIDRAWADTLTLAPPAGDWIPLSTLRLYEAVFRELELTPAEQRARDSASRAARRARSD